ncbi:hypothetical protein BaRGS_00032372 [Batillaria attramentaria]|uniref:SWIM-type domain-containing protein n=1 Tax=Batillaria attramentaria TaxID=370345 RepID=A0ABD0JPI0_9CAEN
MSSGFRTHRCGHRVLQKSRFCKHLLDTAASMRVYTVPKTIKIINSDCTHSRFSAEQEIRGSADHYAASDCSAEGVAGRPGGNVQSFFSRGCLLFYLQRVQW